MEEVVMQTVEQIFKEYDEDGNGYLESKEIERFVR